MPIILKTRDGGQVTCATHRLSCLSELPFYNDVVYIRVISEPGQEPAEMPSWLPKRLQMLICPNCSLTLLPPLPESLLVLYAENNRLITLPDLQHLGSLETVNLSGNSITNVDLTSFPPALKTLYMSDNILRTFTVAQWPEHLVELDLSSNRLEELDPSFDSLVTTCKVSIKYNDFPPQKHNAYTIWITPLDNPEQVVSKVAYVRRFARFGIPVKVKGDNLPSDDWPHQPLLAEHTRQLREIQTIQSQPVAVSATIYTDSQNVHAQSIQRSTDSSVAWLIQNATRVTDAENSDMEYPRNIRNIRSRAIEDLKRNWRPKRFYQICKWLNMLKANKILAKNAAEETIHSIHGISYGELITCIWQAIKAHEHCYEILMVLQQEIVESGSLCFTGRFTRALNSLSGFLEQVNVQISENEQMSHRITQCLKQLAATYEEGTEAYENAGRIEVGKILDEFHVSTCHRQAWLDAV